MGDIDDTHSTAAPSEGGSSLWEQASQVSHTDIAATAAEAAPMGSELRATTSMEQLEPAPGAGLSLRQVGQADHEIVAAAGQACLCSIPENYSELPYHVRLSYIALELITDFYEFVGASSGRACGSSSGSSRSTRCPIHDA